MQAPDDASGLDIPLVGVPVSIGRDLWQLISSTGACGGDCGVSVRFEPYSSASLPSYEVGGALGCLDVFGCGPHWSGCGHWSHALLARLPDCQLQDTAALHPASTWLAGIAT
jgi:hypothetical protein